MGADRALAERGLALHYRVRPRTRAKLSPGSLRPNAVRHAIIGTGNAATSCVTLVCDAADGKRECAVVIDTRAPGDAIRGIQGVPVAGPLDSYSREQLGEAADEFILAFGPDDQHEAVGAARRLIKDKLKFHVMPEAMGCVYHLLQDLGWNEVPVLRTHHGVRHAVARASKRTGDVLISALVGVLLLPLMALIALLIRLESPGPVIFTQERVGRNGRIFSILKFRTMVADAQAQEAKLTADCSSDPRFVKIDCDPRVTSLGRILRKTSIDELPQLWNVLRGEMSLVGPRPSQPSEVLLYEPEHFTRLLVKPGITGMWQVSGRSELAFEDAVELDTAYVRDWSPLLDFKILYKTVAVVLRCRGAC